MVYHRQLTMDQTELVETSITVAQMVANAQSALIRGGMNDAKRYVRSARGQLERIEDKIGVANDQTGPVPSTVRSPEQLADISFYEWEHMDVLQKANVLLEHFVNGSTYDPLDCGFCRDLEDVRKKLLNPVPA